MTSVTLWTTCPPDSDPYNLPEDAHFWTDEDDAHDAAVCDGWIVIKVAAEARTVAVDRSYTMPDDDPDRNSSTSEED